MTNEAVFKDIADRYDRINTLLSFGQDVKWRRRGIERLPIGRVIDLGAGTGAANAQLAPRLVTAVDPSEQMLAINPAVDKHVAPGEALPFEGETFDGVFSAFVFRNLDSVPKTLREINRVLRPGGVAVIIDLGRPESAILRMVHRLGSFVALNAVGLAVGNREEYSYLHSTLDKLPQPDVIYADSPMPVHEIWRMGPFGFVYGVELRKPS